MIRGKGWSMMEGADRREKAPASRGSDRRQMALQASMLYIEIKG
jgi:hypothetical protein